MSSSITSSMGTYPPLLGGLAGSWGHPPTERQGGRTIHLGGFSAVRGDITPIKAQPLGHTPTERKAWGQWPGMGTYPPHQRSSMGTYPSLKVSHGDIPPTKGQPWGHHLHRRSGPPAIHLGGVARFTATYPHRRSWGQRSKVRCGDNGQAWGHTPH